MPGNGLCLSESVQTGMLFSFITPRDSPRYGFIHMGVHNLLGRLRQKYGFHILNPELCVWSCNSANKGLTIRVMGLLSDGFTRWSWCRKAESDALHTSLVRIIPVQSDLSAKIATFARHSVCAHCTAEWEGLAC